MNNVTKLVSPSRCTGCSACRNACSKDAIEMISNEEGFLIPKINSEMCVDCGICQNKCPVANPSYINNKDPQCLAVAAKDEIRLKSASGGIYSAFAQYLIMRGGYICGASYGSQSWIVKHIVGNTEDILDRTRSSKYVQSDAGLVYREIKALLDQGKEVLFSGTPCQVAALYAFLGKRYDKLYTMDLVCHGVPSSKVLRKYLKETYGEENVVKIDFRSKEVFGWTSSVTVELKNGEIYRNTHDKDVFYRAFLSCMALRKSCETCPFSQLPRQGDLTIGDFWGISRYDASLNDKNGTSVVLVNNQKGMRMIELISESLNLKKEVPIEYAINGNKNIEHPFRAHYGRKHFFSMLDLKPLGELVKNARENHYDVGIVGPWYGLNYGSILTYYALYETVKQHGMDPFLLAKPHRLWNENYAKADSIAGRFIYPRCNVMNNRNHDYDWAAMNKNCDIFMVGSDVIWNHKVFGKDAGAFFFLDFVKNSKKKISFASSFGAEYHTLGDAHAKNQYFLKQFDAVSVREKEGVDICKNHFGISADVVLDPVFLCEKEKYYRIADEIVEGKANFIMAYVLGVNEKKRNVLLDLKIQMNMEIRCFPNPNVGERKRADEVLRIPLVENDSVEYWLHSMKECNYYIGDSFHGMCFALIFHKEFVCVINPNQARERFENLLQICGLEERLVYVDDSYDKIEKLLNKKIDYEDVEKRLQKHIEKSNAWLHNALYQPKELVYSENDRILELEEQVGRLAKMVEEMKK